MTKQKALMLSIFRSDLCKGQHRTADELLAFAKERMPGISRATVYNNLKALEEEGFIRKISGEDGADMYDAAFELHGHMICRTCKSVKDIAVPELLEALKRLSGVEVEAYELKLRYVCDDCKKKYKDKYDFSF
ncbi:MAG: transcriptional repressor [Ruminococcaceae bacterium]|nr:transcriptional repressor [Oscillospiraceae bacterium]